MKNLAQVLLLWVAVGFFQNALGMELATHGGMTYYAFQRSILGQNPNFSSDFGVPQLDDSMQIYFDGMTGRGLRERQNQTTDEQEILVKKLNIDGIDPYSPIGWMMRGAIREDDAPPPLGDDSPISNEYRVFNHFFDPIYDRPLTVGGLTPCFLYLTSKVLGAVACEKNPDWALGLGSRARNRFSILDAREAQYRALTGQDSKGNILKSIGTLQKPDDIRKGYLATMFRSLGDVVHLLQDMAQPQHTRNEAHSGAGSNWIQENISGHESLFEKYTEQRAIGEDYVSTSGQTRVKKPPLLIYDGYPIPSFTSYRQFFTTRDQDSIVMSRKGLADFSNRTFFSAAKNIGNTEYAYPNPDSTAYKWQPYVFQFTDNLTQEFTIAFGSIADSVNPDRNIPQYPISAHSVFDEFLVRYIGKADYMLNRPVLDGMADQLIPRAVAYSAGLINYFFRGKLDWDDDLDNIGAHRIWNKGPETINGTFQLYYDAVDGIRYPIFDAVWKGEIKPNNSMNNIIVPKIKGDQPQPKAPGQYVLVFNGDMGNEKSENGNVGAVASLQISSALNIKLYRSVQTTDNVGLVIHFVDLLFDYSGGNNFFNKLKSGAVVAENMTFSIGGRTVPCKVWELNTLSEGIRCEWIDLDARNSIELSFIRSRGELVHPPYATIATVLPANSVPVTDPIDVTLSNNDEPLYKFTMIPTGLNTCYPNAVTCFYSDIQFTNLENVTAHGAVDIFNNFDLDFINQYYSGSSK